MSVLYPLAKQLLFRLDAETAHHLTLRTFQALADVPPFQALLGKCYRGSDAGLSKTVFGLPFRNPIGLAAGFDKDARYLREWDLLGFGFVEMGTLTPRAQPGNPRPRLFRLPEDQALINRLGFNNEGVDAAARRLEATPRPNGLIVGGNIGKNKDTPNDQATRDYLTCLKKLHGLVDYFVVNVSSPNTPGLRELQDKEPLRQLLLSLQDYNQGQVRPRPLLLKIAPDLHPSQLEDIVAITTEARLAGLVATNTTIERKGLQTSDAIIETIGPGGLSGAPLRGQSSQILRFLRQRLPANVPIIGVGGIDSADAARQRLQDGAALVQLYSGLIYQGPDLVSRIKKGLQP